jgi:hypothetical protein
MHIYEVQTYSTDRFISFSGQEAEDIGMPSALREEIVSRERLLSILNTYQLFSERKCSRVSGMQRFARCFHHSIY